MRLKRNAITKDCSVYGALVGLLRQSLAERNDTERKGRRLQFLQAAGGVEMPTDVFMSPTPNLCPTVVATGVDVSGRNAVVANAAVANAEAPCADLRSLRGEHIARPITNTLCIPHKRSKAATTGSGDTIVGPEIDRLTAGVPVLLYEGTAREGLQNMPQCTLQLSTNLTKFHWTEVAGRRRGGIGKFHAHASRAASSNIYINVAVPMDAIKSIVFGPCTDTFRRRGNLLASEPWQCFSFITDAGSVDFAATKDRDARTVIVGVQLIKCVLRQAPCVV